MTFEKSTMLRTRLFVSVGLKACVMPMTPLCERFETS
jgi:hypothetical protein